MMITPSSVGVEVGVPVGVSVGVPVGVAVEADVVGPLEELEPGVDARPTYERIVRALEETNGRAPQGTRFV